MQESPGASLIRIYSKDGGAIGAGFLVGERQILTCAHIVNQACNLTEHLLNVPQDVVSLDFPLISPRTFYTAKVVQWCPLLADGRGDIAGLELQSEPPAGAEVVRFASAKDMWEHPFRAFGFPSGYDDGVWATGRLLGRQATDWVMIEDVKAQGFSVGPGFSGTPVWDTLLQGVVGMVVAASQPADTKAAFVIPLDVLVAAWPIIESITRLRVFLSAAPADTDFAGRLALDLTERDIVVWNEQNTPGVDQTDKGERIRQAIRAAQTMILVVSSQTRSSRTVKEHLRLADLYQQRLILVRVGNEEPAQAPPLGWQETVWVDARDTHYAAAIEAIEANLSRSRTISRLLGSTQAASKEPRNPYKGLQAFTADDVQDFFGRDRLIDELVNDVAKALAAVQPTTERGRLVTIIGPSGSGKSSVAMAGLLPRLQRGALPGSEAWVFLSPMMPGKHPIEELGLTLAAHFPDRSFTSIREDLEDDATRGLHVLTMQLVKRQARRVVLLVDQFEELFTQTESEDERQRFIDLLLTATSEPHGSLLVLLTLRADFYDRPMQYPVLNRLMQACLRQVLPMDVEDLHTTIVQPAALSDVQLTFEGNLVGDLLFEVQGQVGALPLLQFTLEQLFERRSGHQLTLQAYHEIDGVKGALAKHAEATYAGLPSEEHRRMARALFLRLIEPGVTEQVTTRRHATLTELSLPSSEQTTIIREVAYSFVTARLLTMNEMAGSITIEVSHEALIREWDRLTKWLHEAREDISRQQAISADAADWEQRGRPVDRVYHGTELTEAQAWAERNVPSTEEVAFLKASLAEHKRQEEVEQSRQARELKLKRQTVNRLRGLVAIISLFLVASIVLASVIEINLQQNMQLLQIARSRALAANAIISLSQNELDRALLLSVKANQVADTYEARNSLLTALEYSPHILNMLRQESSINVNTLAFGSDGRTLVSSDDNRVYVWDTNTKAYHTLPLDLKTMKVRSVALSPDGQVLVTSSTDAVWSWDLKTGSQLDQLDGKVNTPPGILSPTYLAFSSDGMFLASGRCHAFASTPIPTCTETDVIVWNMHTKEQIGLPCLVHANVTSIALSPNGMTLAYGSDTNVGLYNIATGMSSQLSGSTGAKSVAFSSDGKRLASGGNDRTIQVWDMATRQLSGPPLAGQTEAITSLAFSHNSDILASGSMDKTIWLWDVAGQPIGSPLVGHTGAIKSLAFSPNSNMLVSGSANGIILLWNIGADSPVDQRSGKIGGLWSAVFSSDGTTVFTGSDDGKIFPYDVKTGKPLDPLKTVELYPPRKLKPGEQENLSTILSLVLSRDGQVLAVGRRDGTILLLNTKTKKVFAHFQQTNLLNKIVRKHCL